MMKNDAAAEAIRVLADSISPLGASATEDATGGYVKTLTEATMGITAGLCKIADAIERLADVLEEQQKRNTP